MGRHDDQNGAVLSQRAIDRENHPSPPEVRTSTDGPKQVQNVRRSTCMVRIIAYEAILAHFRTKIHDERRNDKTSSFQDP